MRRNFFTALDIEDVDCRRPAAGLSPEKSTNLPSAEKSPIQFWPSEGSIKCPLARSLSLESQIPNVWSHEASAMRVLSGLQPAYIIASWWPVGRQSARVSVLRTTMRGISSRGAYLVV